MRTFAEFATWMFPDLNWLSMKEGLDEFAALMKSQLDLSVEAKNLSKFRANFEKHPDIVFPRPFLSKQVGILIQDGANGLTSILIIPLSAQVYMGSWDYGRIGRANGSK